MLTNEAPSWFKWFFELGENLVSLENLDPQSAGVTVFLSVPTAEYVASALTLGAINTKYVSNFTPELGDRVTTWVGKNFGEFEVKQKSNTHISIGGQQVPFPGWPMTYVPIGTPESRTPGKVPEEERKSILQVSGVHPHAWHKWYASICIYPVSIIGHKSELLGQADDLRTSESSWLDTKGAQLLRTYSQQITNPDRFQFFPFSIFSPEVTQNRSWLRKMESRLVICESFSAYELMHPQYQQLAPRVVLMDRRKDSSVKGNNLIRERQDMPQERGSAQLEEVLTNAPAGVYAYFNYDSLKEDTGDLDMNDLDAFEL